MSAASPPYEEADFPESAVIDRRVLIDLVEDGAVDCGRVVQIVQLMAMPEFKAFFTALCEINLAEAARAANALARCAEALQREDVTVADIVAITVPARSP